MIKLSELSHIKTFGKSMHPFLRDGDIVYFDKVPYDKIKTGDIVVAGKGDEYITHRVIYKQKDYLITKGDHNTFSDKPFRKDQIIGRVYEIKRKNKVIPIEKIYLMQSSLYYENIKFLMRLLRESNIDFVILKGLPLHLYYEGRHPKRIYTDCDILINPEDFNKTKTLLLKNGYKKMRIEGRSRKQDSYMLQETFFTKLHGYPIIYDLHKDSSSMMTNVNTKEAFYPRSLLQDLSRHLINTKRIITVEKVQYPVLSVPNLIVYLSHHFFHHNYRGIFRLEFLHIIICREAGKDGLWKDAAKIINNYQLENMVYPVFIMLKMYYNQPADGQIPAGFLKKIKPRSLVTDIGIKLILKQSPYDDLRHVKKRIIRFLYLFFLSPQPLHKKFSVFFNREVWSTVYSLIMSGVLRKPRK